MQEIIDLNRCTGCGACAAACPKSAITMTMNEEGFLYPKINQSLCIDCGKCRFVCPVDKEYSDSNKTVAYAFQNTNQEVRRKSSSGGFFTELAERTLEENGVVCGAVYDENMRVVHMISANQKDIQKLQRSKYVQSNIGELYGMIKKYLLEDRKVLFVGLPCQAAALHSFLGSSYKNLLLVDLVCYGVPSPGLFNSWIEYLNKKYSDRVNDVVFRDKRYGYATPNIVVHFNDRKPIQSCRDANVYSNLFFKNLSTRSCCFNCSFKSIHRVTDITLGDLWLMNRYAKELDDNLGTTAVFAHTEKGRKLCEQLCQITLDLDEVVKADARKLVESAKPGERRSEFLRDMTKLEFEELINKYEPDSFQYRQKMRVKRILNMLGISKRYYKHKKEKRLR